MDADLAHATMTKYFMETYPDRFFNAGIAEANMTDMAVGPDGGSHESIEDVALMVVLPHMTIFCPADEAETEKALRAAARIAGPVYIRLSRAVSCDFHGGGALSTMISVP